MTAIIHFLKKKQIIIHLDIGSYLFHGSKTFLLSFCSDNNLIVSFT